MNAITIYHNPKCSKSKKALELIHQQKIAPAIVPYLSSPLDLNQLKALHQLLQVPVREMLRPNEKAYAELNLDDLEMDDDTILRQVIRYPHLLQRPIIVLGDRAIIARPPEKVFELLGNTKPD